MMKLLTSLAGASVFGLLLVAMTPLISAGPVQRASKSDRLDICSYGPGCTERGWPYHEATCLRAAHKGEAKRVRVITLDRLPNDVTAASGEPTPMPR